jgi:ferredoxin-NADP reductase
MKTINAEVTEVITNTPTVKTIVLKPETPIPFKPGQWIYIFADSDGERIKRPYSVASHPSNGTLNLCVKRIKDGFMSNFLCDIKEGTKMEIAGPFGLFTLKETDKDIVFVATGTGLAPFMSMIPELIEKGYKGNVTVVFGVRSHEEVLYEKEMKEFSEQINLKFVPVLSREEWDGEIGHVQDALKKMRLEDSNVYICGLIQMVTETRKLLEKMGLTKDQVHFENYI